MNVHAIIVGIEHYHALDDGIDIELDGPASDAVRFAEWLLKREVPPANLHVFLSPLDRNARLNELKLAPGGQQLADAVQPATREAIEDFFNNKLGTLITSTSATLYVLWGGHGVMRGGREHHLLYQDFRKNSPLTFKLEDRLDQLRTFPKISTQHIFIDACANYVELSQFGNKLDSSTPKIDSPDPTVTQHLLMAAASGQKAKNDKNERTGFFSRELLNQFPNEGWPSAEVLAPKLEAIFLKKGRDDRAFRQRPVRLSFRPNQGGGFDLGGQPKPFGLQELAQVAGCTISQLDGLAGLASSKMLDDPAHRDTLYALIVGAPMEDRAWRNDADFDRAGLAAWTLHRRKITELVRELDAKGDLSFARIQVELERVNLARKAVELLDELDLSTEQYLAAFRRIPDTLAKPGFFEDMITSLAQRDTIKRSPLFRFLLDICSTIDPAQCAAIEKWIEDQASANYLADLRQEFARKRNYRVLISVQIDAGPLQTPRSIGGILLENGVSRKRKVTCDLADPKDLFGKLEEVYSELLADLEEDISVELIFPFGLLSHPVEETGIISGLRPKKKPLCHRYPFVLRWGDRIKHPKKYLAEKWTRAGKRERTRMQEQGYQPSLCPFPADEHHKFWKILDEEPQCALLDLGHQSPDPDNRTLEEVLLRGAAYVCWSRAPLSPAVPSYRETLASLVGGGAFAELPTRAVEPREKAAALRSLALFWDDPESNPKDYLSAFEELK